jgi:hypothetical protein
MDLVRAIDYARLSFHWRLLGAARRLRRHRDRRRSRRRVERCLKPADPRGTDHVSGDNLVAGGNLKPGHANGLTRPLQNALRPRKGPSRFRRALNSTISSWRLPGRSSMARSRLERVSPSSTPRRVSEQFSAVKVDITRATLGRPWCVRFFESDHVGEAETSAMNSSPDPVRRSSYQSAALRSSARASGCSSRRTSLFELLQDLAPRGFLQPRSRSRRAKGGGPDRQSASASVNLDPPIRFRGDSAHSVHFGAPPLLSNHVTRLRTPTENSHLCRQNPHASVRQADGARTASTGFSPREQTENPWGSRRPQPSR